MNPGLMRSSSSLQFSWKQTVYLHSGSCLKQLAVALLHSSKSHSKVICVAGRVSTGLRSLTALSVKNCVDSSAAESPRKKMPPKRKLKQAATVEEEEKVRETKVKKLSDEVHKVAPDEGQERPPLSKGVHPGSLHYFCSLVTLKCLAAVTMPRAFFVLYSILHEIL